MCKVRADRLRFRLGKNRSVKLNCQTVVGSTFSLLRNLFISDLSLDGWGCQICGFWITEVLPHLPWLRCLHWEQGVWGHKQCPKAAQGLWPVLGCLVFVSEAPPCLLTKETREILAENAVPCCPAEMTTSRRAEGGRRRKAKRKVLFQA